MPVIAVDGDTVTAADAYFETRLNSSTWSGATELEKSQALTTASNMLDDIAWKGVPFDTDYSFPAYILGSAAETPQKVFNAVYEQAIHLLKIPALLFEEETVETLVLGPIQLQKIKKIPPFSALIYRIAGEFMLGSNGASGGGVWWRAN